MKTILIVILIVIILAILTGLVCVCIFAFKDGKSGTGAGAPETTGMDLRMQKMTMNNFQENNGGMNMKEKELFHVFERDIVVFANEIIGK